MKKRIIEAVLGLTMTAMLLSGCATYDNAEYADTTIIGQVNEVGKNTITVELGVQDAMEKPEDEQGEEANESGEKNADAQNIEDILTGEVCEFKLDDDTEILRQEMGGQPGGMGNGEMPEKPDGDNTENGGMTQIPQGGENGEMPQIPQGGENGEMTQIPQGGENGGMMGIPNGGQMGGTQEEIELSEIEEGDMVSITFDEEGEMEQILVMSMGEGMMQGQGMQANGVDHYDAVEEYIDDTEVEDLTISSTGADENAIHVYEGAEVLLDNVTVERDSADSTGGDNSSFYGVGAAILNTEGTAYIKDSTITSDAAGGAGAFSYGEGVTYVADTKITTQQDTSGGVHVAGGGILYAWNLDVTTDGESSAAIRSDRGSGTMVVEDGTYVSNGVGSPAIYSTADIAVKDASLTANGSEAICIEGLNSIHLYDSDLSGNMAENEQNDCIWNVILYQSMSGDSEVGNSTFQMQGGSLTAKNGGMFYTTNTESTFTLENVDLTYSAANPFFLKCTGNQNKRGWGKEGNNGADCKFTAISQEMQGNIIWDSISQLDFYMTDGSTLNGAVFNDESCAGTGGDGYCNFYIEEGCTWTVTADSTLSNLYCEGKIVDANGKTVKIVDKEGNVCVEGNSEITIAVDKYEAETDLKEASKIAVWSEYEVKKPSQLK